MKKLAHNPTSHSNVPEKNMTGIAAASNTFQDLFMSMLNANDVDYSKTV